MTIHEIKERIQAIKDCAGDDEAAHSMEDTLREEFIAYVHITSEVEHLSEKAKLILSTSEIEFSRWCA